MDMGAEMNTRELVLYAGQLMIVMIIMIFSLALAFGIGWAVWHLHPIAGILAGVIACIVVTPIGWTASFYIGYRWK
jgi:hypothetical protein